MSKQKNPGYTRTRLLDEGVTAFLTHGYHGTGIKQILDAVGIPKGSFYNYFESKEAFGVAAIDHYVDCLSTSLTDAMSGAPDALSGLRKFFEMQLKNFEQANFVGGCLVANLGAEFEGSAAFRKALSSAVRRYQSGVANALKQAQDDGTIRNDIPANDLAETLVDAWEGAVIRMKIEQTLAPLHHCLDHLLKGYFKP